MVSGNGLRYLHKMLNENYSCFLELMAKSNRYYKSFYICIRYARLFLRVKLAILGEGTHAMALSCGFKDRITPMR